MGDEADRLIEEGLDEIMDFGMDTNDICAARIPIVSNLWPSRDGLLPIESMTSTHLFFSVRMLWNNLLPKKYQFEPFRRWGLDSRSNGEWADLLGNLLLELETRDDLPEWMVNQLNEMRLRAKGVKLLNKRVLRCLK